MVWFVMAGMAALAAVAAIWPLVRASLPRGSEGEASGETAFYKAQLEEIQRDVTRGLLPQSEAANARAETARRLLAIDSKKLQSLDSAPIARLSAAIGFALAVPAIAFSVYASIGRPGMADEPLASRSSSMAQKDVSAAIAGVEAHLTSKPGDGKGWAVLAPVYMRLGRYEDAAHAYSEALRLLGEDPSRRAAYGEALIAQAGGIVTDNARTAFEKALAERPDLPQARFYMALAAEQDGKKDDALHAYEALAAQAPEDAPWLGTVRARIAALGGEPSVGQADAPGKVSADQTAMIKGMVSQLADRLADKGGSVDEWTRLIRAYTVLHEGDRAKAALADARKALSQDAASVARLDQIARDLGLGERN